MPKEINLEPIRKPGESKYQAAGSTRKITGKFLQELTIASPPNFFKGSTMTAFRCEICGVTDAYSHTSSPLICLDCGNDLAAAFHAHFNID